MQMDVTAISEVEDEQVIKLKKKIENGSISAATTLRFELDLIPGNLGFAEFNYKQLLKASSATSQRPFGCFGNDDSTSGYININCFGYDNTDSFIDDSEPHDELLSREKRNGFYVNAGRLNFRDSSANDPTAEKPGKNRSSVKIRKATASNPRKRKLLENEVVLAKKSYMSKEASTENPVLSESDITAARKSNIEIDDTITIVSSEDENLQAFKAKESEVTVPKNITSRLDVLLNKVKHVADEAGDSRYRFFSRRPFLGDMLVEINAETLKLSQSDRTTVFKYLSQILNFSVHTLKGKIRKQLLLQKAELEGKLSHLPTVEIVTLNETYSPTVEREKTSYDIVDIA